MFASAESVVPRVLSDVPNPGLPFEEVLGEVTKRHDLALPDKVVPLSSLRATDDGLISVPGLGNLALTVWARRALARILGIRWDRWFASETIAPADRAIEINRRFLTSSDAWKIRARRLDADATQQADGTLRAFVTPTYGPIDDVEVFETLGRSLAGQLDAFRFIRRDVTCESSQYAAIHVEKVDLGIDKPDPHRNGFLAANSEVGSRSLTLLVWCFRLVCTNGMVAADSEIFRMVHRRRKEGSMAGRLAQAFGLLPQKWKRAEAILRAARRERADDPYLALEVLIDSNPALSPISQSVFEAFDAEPEPTRFGIVQAITRAAQRLTPEQRLSVEELAGRVAAGTPLQGSEVSF